MSFISLHLSTSMMGFVRVIVKGRITLIGNVFIFYDFSASKVVSRVFMMTMTYSIYHVG